LKAAITTKAGAPEVIQLKEVPIPQLKDGLVLIKVKALERGTFVPANEDEKQQEDLFSIIHHLLHTETGPFYFFDLHTTSSETIPFMTVNDSLLNRQFTQQYPVPIILGIEEYLNGPILSYINELGYVSFGFESGQHDSIKSVENHVAFVYLSILYAGAVEKNNIDYKRYAQALNNSARSIYEIYERHEIKDNERFLMEPGFVNFQSVKKGQVLAMSDDSPLLSKNNSTVFMPLYQPKGDDGFFMIRKIPIIFLHLSSVFRKLRIDRILPLLPGVRWRDGSHDTLIVNLKIARLMAKQFLHILGYRSKTIDETHLIIKNRESSSRNEDYSEAVWKN